MEFIKNIFQIFHLQNCLLLWMKIMRNYTHHGAGRRNFLIVILFLKISLMLAFFQTQNLHNISYGDSEKQKIDIYYPPDSIANTQQTVIVIIHGGGFQEGIKICMHLCQSIYSRLVTQLFLLDKI